MTSGYIFVHFIGEQADGEQVYFSVSEDGLHFRDLNGGQPVLRSHLGDGGVRDPFLVRHPQTGRYYLIATDLCIHRRKSWGSAVEAGSRDLIVWESEDLIRWAGPRAVTVGVADAGCVWAPEAVFDEARGEFFVFWASAVQQEGDPERKQRIYGAYTADFIRFTEPFLYAENVNHLIDMNIVREGGWYYRFVKDETTKTIRMERMRTLSGPAEPMPCALLDGLYGVEGPECYPLPDGRWCLIVDRFMAHLGYLPLVTEDLSSGVFTALTEGAFDLGLTKKRHGGVMQISLDTLAALVAAFPG